MRKFFVSVIAAIVLLCGVTEAAAAPPPKPTPVSTLGNDVSWPQCGGALPTSQAFGLVGVNGGIASTTNPCLATQLAWAWRSSGVTAQPKAQLYVNTANPGLASSAWPTSNVDPEGAVAPNPAGTCDGNDSPACAWQYGWNRAVEDIVTRFTPAANAVGVSADATGYLWWLDVETANSWKSGSDAALDANRSVLEAMTTKFQAIGARVGIYSTTYQLGVIAGTVPATSPLAGLDSWLPGARNEKTARANCRAAPLTPGSRVVLTQFVSGGFDVDVSCV